MNTIQDTPPKQNVSEHSTRDLDPVETEDIAGIANALEPFYDQNDEKPNLDSIEDFDDDDDDEDFLPPGMSVGPGRATARVGGSGNILRESFGSLHEARKRRCRVTSEQLRVLEMTYRQDRMPPSEERENLSTQLGMTPRRVQVWFQNRRAKDKRARATLRLRNSAEAEKRHLQAAQRISRVDRRALSGGSSQFEVRGIHPTAPVAPVFFESRVTSPSIPAEFLGNPTTCPPGQMISIGLPGCIPDFVRISFMLLRRCSCGLTSLFICRIAGADASISTSTVSNGCSPTGCLPTDPISCLLGGPATKSVGRRRASNSAIAYLIQHASGFFISFSSICGSFLSEVECSVSVVAAFSRAAPSLVVAVCYAG